MFIKELDAQLPKISDKNVESAVKTARVLHKNGTIMGLAIWKSARIFNVDPKKVAREIATIAKEYVKYRKEHGIMSDKEREIALKKKEGRNGQEDYKKASGGDNARTSW